MALNLVKITKQYNSNQNSFSMHASISFPDTGLVCILGKSGCGKSTLLHILGLLEKPDSGNIFYNDKRITNLSKEDKENYLNNIISYVFQNYQLIEDKSILFNIALPMMIGGVSEKEAYKKATELLEQIDFPKEKYKQIVNQCSGGEKQRVAVLRSMINKPAIILADEPTGALDSKNSKMVMDILKGYSYKGLVIVVTHNQELAKEYADRIVTLSDGRISGDVTFNNEHNPILKKEFKRKKHSKSWVNHFVNHNLKKRFKRNLVSAVGIIFSLVFAFIIFGFSNGATKEIERQSLRQFDLGVSTISIQKTKEIEGTQISLVQSSRLSSKEMISFVTDNDYLSYGLNYSALLPTFPVIKYDKDILQEYSYNPVYSFKSPYAPELLIEGRLPGASLGEVVINKKLRDDFIKKYRKSPLNEVFEVSYTRDVTTYFDDELNPYIIDYFTYLQEVKIVGVVDELNFLNTPKIYYSYIALDSYMDTCVMNNLSKYMNDKITFKDKIDQCTSNDELSSYSHMLFLKNIGDFEKLNSLKLDAYQISNGALVIKEALDSFVSATTMGMEIFLIITALGSVLILAITSYSSYSQDKHANAILLALGANNDSIFDIYSLESLAIGLTSFAFSIGISILVQPLLNSLIYSFTEFQNMIQIPFNSFMNFRFLLPVIVFGATLITSFLSSYLPMAFSKRIIIAKELKEE